MARNSSHERIEPTLAIGKNGITNSVITELKNQLGKRKIIKVRLHGESKLSRLEVAKELAAKANAKLIDVRGFTVVLTRKR